MGFFAHWGLPVPLARAYGFVKAPRLASGAMRQAAATVLLLAALGAASPVAGAQGASEPSESETAKVTISREDCRRLVRHVPAGDVAYQGGQDVYGRPVAPADLDGGFQLDLPERFEFDLAYQPLERDDLDLSTFSVGRVSVNVLTGQVTYNGRPMQSDAQAELSALCQKVLQGR